MSQHNKKQSGFTVIELTLAMAFLAFIMLFTTMTIIQMMRTYNKGLTIKQINQSGRTLVEDLSRSLSAGVASDVDVSYINQGRLCVGNAVYMWTPVYNGTTYSASVYTQFNGKPASLIRTERSTLLCSNSASLSLASSDNRFALLSDQARVLSVDVERYGVGNRLVQLTFQIGTFDQTEEPSLDLPVPNKKNIYVTPYYDGGNLTCRPDTNGNFCAFGTFKTTVYVGN